MQQILDLNRNKAVPDTEVRTDDSGGDACSHFYTGFSHEQHSHRDKLSRIEGHLRL